MSKHDKQNSLTPEQYLKARENQAATVFAMSIMLATSTSTLNDIAVLGGNAGVLAQSALKRMASIHDELTQKQVAP